MISAKVIADSVTEQGQRITTMELCYPKYIHGEFMTHRVFSRNARSSRAVPVKKILHEVATDPVEPSEWLSNKAGMQGGEPLVGFDLDEAQRQWRSLAKLVSERCESLGKLLHKQWANRPLEAFSNIYVVVTSTHWNNFYQLRRHPAAQPEIRILADAMYEAHVASRPVILNWGIPGTEWHLPYLDPHETESLLGSDWRSLEISRRISAARCARVSYKTFDNKTPTVEEDLQLFNRLMGSQPLHASPSEHQAAPDPYCMNMDLWGNFEHWVQFRKTLPGESGNVDCGVEGVQ